MDWPRPKEGRTPVVRVARLRLAASRLVPPRSTASVSTCPRFTATFRSCSTPRSYEWVLKKKHCFSLVHAPKETCGRLLAERARFTRRARVVLLRLARAALLRRARDTLRGSSGLRCWPACFPACPARDHRVGHRDDPGGSLAVKKLRLPPKSKRRRRSALRPAACSCPPPRGTEQSTAVLSAS